jgi:protein-export membrane protein SecD/preprotein translocase SecF subunit
LKQALTLLALVALAAVSIWFSVDPRFPIREGLDLQGGMRVTLEPDPTDPAGAKATAEDMLKVRDVIENRVNNFGLSGAEVRLKGDKQILVQLPGAKDPKEALERISKVAQLEFRHLNNVVTDQNPGRPFRMSITPGDVKKGEPDLYKFFDVGTNKEAPVDEVLKTTEIIVKGDSLKPVSKAEINPSSGQPLVVFEFDQKGAQTFGDFTSNNVGEILAVVLDHKIISAPNIKEPITEGHGTISGGFRNMAEARVLSNLLNSGALPVPLRPAETQYVGATLGQESVNRSIQAGLVGLALVLVFMLAYYWFPGLLACIALLIYAAITFSIFKGAGFLPPIVLDLPGITGFILSVGMAVDANILIFERLKEELRSGKPLRAAIDAGFSRAFSSILDSNVTTWIVCAILIWLGAPIIKGFAINLAIGVAVSMFTAITVTRTLLHLSLSMGFARNPAVYAPNVGWLAMIYPPSRQGAVLRVFENRKYYFGFSILLAVLGIIFTAMTPFGHGLRPGIDFTGGTTIESAFRGDVTREALAPVLERNGLHDATISIGRSEAPWTNASLEAKGADLTTEARVKDALTSIRGFDPDTYKPEKTGDTFKASATFTTEVTQAELEQLLKDQKLTGAKATTQAVNHSGDNAVKVALINTRKLAPPELAKLREDLKGVAGGIVTPLYQDSSIGPSVAAEVTLLAFWSVSVASLAIILYLAFRFAIGGFLNGLKFGVCAVIALIHDVGVVIGLFALMGALRGWQVDSLFVTACLTVLGFSVHDTIVVYDRIRENLIHRQRGETFADINDKSITQTFDRSVNTSFTVMLVVAALVFFGGESIKLFNTALLVGIGIGTYSSIFVASPLVVLIERWTRGSAAQPAAATGRRESGAGRGPAGPGRGPTGPRREPAAPAAATAAADGTETAEPRPTAAGTPRPTTGGAIRPRKKRRL